jgi:hypothetical protein
MRISLIAFYFFWFLIQGFSQYDVIVEVKNADGSPVNAKVIIEDHFLQTETINGIAYFKDVHRGKITITVVADGYEIESSRNYNVTADAYDNKFTIKLIAREKNVLIITGHVNLPDTMQLKNAIVVFYEPKSGIIESAIPNSYGYYKFEADKAGLGDRASLSLTYDKKMIKQEDIPIPLNNNLIYNDFDIKPAPAKSIKVKFYYNYPEDFPLKTIPVIRSIYDVENIDGGFIIIVPEDVASDTLSFTVSGSGISKQTYQVSIADYSESDNPFLVEIKREVKLKRPWTEISPAFYQFAYVTNFSNNNENEITGRIQHTVGFYYHPPILKHKCALGLSYTFKTQLTNINSYSTLNGHTGDMETSYNVTNYPALRFKGFVKPFNFNGITFFGEIIFSVSHFESGSNTLTGESENLESVSAYSFYTFIPMVNLGLRYNAWYLTFELSSGFSTYELKTRDYAFDYWGYGYTNYVESKVRFYDIPVNLSIIGNIPSKH